jgi:hypothetical protein
MAVVSFPGTDHSTGQGATVETVITRLTLADAADWQQAIAAECRRQRLLTPSVFAFLKDRRLLDRCTFLASDEGGDALRFLHIGEPTLRVLGRAGGRSMIGQFDVDDPHADFAHSVGAQYAESIGAGEALFNRISVTGMGKPLIYTHALYGWSEGGRRAVLSAVDVRTLH